MKFNPRSLTAPQTCVESREFKAKNGDLFTVRLNHGGGEVRLAVKDLAEELAAKWKHGCASEPHSVPPVVRESLASMIAPLLLLQHPENDEDVWQFIDWAILAQRDFDTFSDVYNWAMSLIG